MASIKTGDREAIASRRLIKVLKEHKISTARTLEQKISDAGPGQMRADPHVLNNARSDLERQGVVLRRVEKNTHWFYLAATPVEDVEAKLAVLRPIHAALQKSDFSKRVGQTLEIATYRALLDQSELETFGSYTDLDKHDDSTLYSKEEPPSNISGRSCGPKKLDFLVSAKGAMAGIEIKNTREWIYPDRDEIRELLLKATALDVLPVLIARRIPYVTFALLNACGVVVHQTYNQLFPDADGALATKARDKRLLGYHDIRLGNQPDARLVKFLHKNLPGLITTMRPKYDEYKDLLKDFGEGSIAYAEFAARMRRRGQGTNEDHDWQEGGEGEEDY